MDHEHNVNRIPSVSDPIPATLKRKRGPSLSGDPPPSGKLKEAADAPVDAVLEGLDELEELEEYDESDHGSDSSGELLSHGSSLHVTLTRLTPLRRISNPPHRPRSTRTACSSPPNRARSLRERMPRNQAARHAFRRHRPRCAGRTRCD